MDKCSICLEVLKKTSIITLECSHTFHIKCYSEFIIHRVRDITDNRSREINAKCPLCRSYDKEMFNVFLESTEYNIGINVAFLFYTLDAEDELIKKFYPTIKCILEGQHNFTKSNLVKVLKDLIDSSSKRTKKLIKDMHSHFI